MNWLFTKLNALLFSLSIVIIFCWHSVSAQPAQSAISDPNLLSSSSVSQPMVVATAAAAPRLGAATLGGKPVYVLSMTRTGDRVMVRCYPGYVPTIKIQSMGGANAAKEGSMTCTGPA